MEVPASGLSNRDVYWDLECQVKENQSCQSSGSMTMCVLAGIISLLAGIAMFVIAVSYDATKNGFHAMPRKHMVIGESVCGGIIASVFALAIFGICILTRWVRKKNHQLTERMQNFPQGNASKGAIGLEHLEGGSQRTDLLIAAFPDMTKNVLQKLNFEQLCILFEHCPKMWESKKSQFTPKQLDVFAVLERYLKESPEKLELILKDINENSIIEDERFFQLLITHLPEFTYSHSGVNAALLATYKSYSGNKKLEETELREKLDAIRAESTSAKNKDDLFIQLD